MPRIVKISPSIAAADLMRLADEVEKLEDSRADAIHFDCMDGHFVPQLTIGLPFIEQMKAITKLPLDVHIMVSNTDAVFMDYINAGADTLTFSFESALHAHRICAKIKSQNKRAGIAINPSTHWKAVEYLLPELDVINVMAVNPGFSHQQHLPFVHRKISELNEFRKLHSLSFEIQVDGGVNAQNAGQLKTLGADNLVAGGAIFKHKNYKEAIAALRNA